MLMRMRTSIGSTSVREQVDVVRVQDDLALVAVAGIEVVHAVEAAQERRLAAARGPDQRGDLLLVIGMLMFFSAWKSP